MQDLYLLHHSINCRGMKKSIDVSKVDASGIAGFVSGVRSRDPIRDRNIIVWALPGRATLFDCYIFLSHIYYVVCSVASSCIMHSPLRIAVLECDTPIDKINRRYNGYGGVFRIFLKASVNALNQPERLDPETGMEITAWDIVNDDKYPNLEDVDAVLLTGSSTYQLGDPKHSKAYTNHNGPKPEHNSFEDTPWINRLVEFTQQVLAQDRVRLLGICFGHQIVGRALGSKVGRSDQGWEIAVCDMDMTDEGKEFFGRDKIVSSLRLRLVSQEAAYPCTSSTCAAS